MTTISDVRPAAGRPARWSVNRVCQPTTHIMKSTFEEEPIEAEVITDDGICALSIVTKAEVIASNFPDFAAAVRARIAELRRDLKTDEDFDLAARDVKIIADHEKKLDDVLSQILNGNEEISTIVNGLNALKAEMAEGRLHLSRQIKKDWEAKRESIVEDALKSLGIKLSLARQQYRAIIETSTKGKRTVDTMRKGADLMAANLKANIERAMKVIREAIAEHGADLVPDVEELAIKGDAVADSEIRRRVDLRKARQENDALAKAKAVAEAEAAKMFGPRGPVGPEQDSLFSAEEKMDDIPPFLQNTPPAPERVGVVPAAKAAPAPPVVPVVDPSDTATEEWAKFSAIVVGAFLPLKNARAALVHAENVERAGKFAAAVSSAWKEVR